MAKVIIRTDGRVVIGSAARGTIKTVEQDTIVQDRPQPRTVHRAGGAVRQVVTDRQVLKVATPGTQGRQGEPGPPGPGGDFNGTTDGVPEGDNNLYFTHERAEAVAEAVAAAHIALHVAHPDPHPQYVTAPIDGGNF